MKLGLLLLAAACTGHHATTPIAAPQAGVVISLYSDGKAETAYGVVDDRRWVAIDHHELVLEHIEPGASLASLVIEPLAGSKVSITRCTREALPEPPPAAPAKAAAPKPPSTDPNVRDREVLRARILEIRRREAALEALRSGKKLPEPPPPPEAPASTAVVDATVRCTAEGATGRQLVRILYVSTKLAYKIQHEIAIATPDHAQLATRFAIETPAWHETAEVIAYDGVPGGARSPTEIARGEVALDGSIAILAAPTTTVDARVRRIFDGAVATPTVDAADAAWNSESTHAVWVWLEIPHGKLAPGPIRVHAALPDEAIHDLELPAEVRGETDDDTLRLPLWTDSQLTGMRQRFIDPTSDTMLENGTSERLLLSVANLGDVPREVWIEEHVRSAKHRKIERAWPKRPTAGGDIVREKVQIKPHAIERVGYTVEYLF